MKAVLRRALSRPALATALGADRQGGLGRVERAVRLLPRARREALLQRVSVLVSTLEPGLAPQDLHSGLDHVARLVSGGQRDVCWLVLAVLGASLPLPDEVERLARSVRTTDAETAIALLLARSSTITGPAGTRLVQVTDDVLVDVHTTVTHARGTGIQRVTRETVRRWTDDRTRFVAWRAGLDGLRDLSAAECAAVRRGVMPQHSPLPSAGADDVVVVPWQGTYLLPELALDTERTGRLRALARWSRSTTGLIGFDCVPITSAETTDAGISEYFANNLAAARHFTSVVAISSAAAAEYQGWTRMLASIGVRGPAIHAVSLPEWAPAPVQADLERARHRFATDGEPLVLCVGSHEPRKNHLAVLHAAHRAWLEGRQFTLAFVGARGWRGAEFAMEARRLADLGFPLVHHEGVEDEELWAAYSLARFLVFPSLNEGFGLPVAEALSRGTPVLTTRYGSLGALAVNGGAVVVDPRDDDEIYRAMTLLLDDDALVARLRDQASARPKRSWDTYAALAWSRLQEGHAPR